MRVGRARAAWDHSSALLAALHNLISATAGIDLFHSATDFHPFHQAEPQPEEDEDINPLEVLKANGF